MLIINVVLRAWHYHFTRCLFFLLAFYFFLNLVYRFLKHDCILYWLCLLIYILLLFINILAFLDERPRHCVIIAGALSFFKIILLGSSFPHLLLSLLLLFLVPKGLFLSLLLHDFSGLRSPFLLNLSCEHCIFLMTYLFFQTLNIVSRFIMKEGLYQSAVLIYQSNYSLKVIKGTVWRHTVEVVCNEKSQAALDNLDMRPVWCYFKFILHETTFASDLFYKKLFQILKQFRQSRVISLSKFV